MGEDSMELLCDDDVFSSECSHTEHCQNSGNIPDSLLGVGEATLGEQCLLLSSPVVVVHPPLPSGLLLIAGIVVRNLAFVS